MQSRALERGRFSFASTVIYIDRYRCTSYHFVMSDKRCATAKPPKIGDTAAAAAVFRAMADPQRLRILAMVANAAGEVCVCDLNECVPLLQPTVSHHLKILRECGLITGTRRANWVYYRPAEGAAEKLRASLAFVMPPVSRATRHKRRAITASRRRAVPSTRPHREVTS
jgi:ArsR family transcriptional regulator